MKTHIEIRKAKKKAKQPFHVVLVAGNSETEMAGENKSRLKATQNQAIRMIRRIIGKCHPDSEVLFSFPEPTKKQTAKGTVAVIDWQ